MSLSDDFIELSRLLLELNSLEMTGEEESNEAESLREVMDGYAFGLKINEIQLIKLLSKDLFSLNKESKPQGVAPESAEAVLFKTAWERHNYMAALKILSKEINLFETKAIQYFRFRAWTFLGCTDVGREFLKDAIRFKDTDNYMCLLIHSYLHDNLSFEAVSLARPLINIKKGNLKRRNYSLQYMVGVALIDFAKGVDENNEDYNDEHLGVVLLKNILPKVKNDFATYSGACITLALFYEREERPHVSKSFYDKAIENSNNNPLVYIARADFYMNTHFFKGDFIIKSREMAIDDYQSAIKFNTNILRPYVHVAKNFMNHEIYNNAIHTLMMARKNVALEDKALGQIYSWLGICYLILEIEQPHLAPNQLSQHFFYSSMELASMSPSVVNNFKSYQNLISKGVGEQVAINNFELVLPKIQKKYTSLQVSEELAFS